MNARRAALDDFTECIRLALETYNASGALIALTFDNKNFEGESALALIARGDTDRVRAWLHSLTGMIAT